MKPVKKAAEMTPAELGRYIDQSVLKPEFTDEDIRKYIQEGIDYNCATVCINPSSLPIARTVCGYQHGYMRGVRLPLREIHHGVKGGAG